MRIDVVTIFPELFDPFLSTGVLGRAVERGLMDPSIHDLRDWAGNRWRQVDDEPYGGGSGMVLQAPPVLAAVRWLTGEAGAESRVLLMSPRGTPLHQALVRELAEESRLVVLCGRYEGFDERVVEISAAEEISIGDFVLGGGEVAAMALIEAVCRLVPGVVGDPSSVASDSFSHGLLDHPCYTRPAEVEGREVPEVLRSGDHEAIRRWRLERAVEATVTRRPDLVKQYWTEYPEEVRRLIERLRPRPADRDR